MNVTLDAAYREACTALGEAEVRSRLQATEIQRLTDLLAEAQRSPGETTD